MVDSFPRIDNLPIYATQEINELKKELRRRGEDVIDLAMGNPNIPAPEGVLKKISEVIFDPKNHRYSISQGLPRLREEIAKRYKSVWGVDISAESEVVVVQGTKEGLFQLLFAILDKDDVVLVPEPAYPPHIWGPMIAGAKVITFDMYDFFDSLYLALKKSPKKPKVLIISYPNNPTAKCVDIDFFKAVVDFALSERIWIIHDFAYADITFDGYKAPSILQVDGAKDCAIEFYSMSKGFCMAGFRIGFALGNQKLVSALKKIKSWMDYGIFQPLQIGAIIALRDYAEFPKKVAKIYEKRRDICTIWLKKIGFDFEIPKGSMFLWVKIPKNIKSMDFAKLLLQKSLTAVTPGIGFGEKGEGYIRIALVENEMRIRQGMRNIKKLMEKL